MGDERPGSCDFDAMNSPSPSSTSAAPAPMVPLCWTDQVQREDTVVLEPTTPKPAKQKAVSCFSSRKFIE